MCLSDLQQTLASPPQSLTEGEAITLRFGACCPRLDKGCIVAVSNDSATLRIGGGDWRLARCASAGGIRVPGLISETWFVVERLDG